VSPRKIVAMVLIVLGTGVIHAKARYTPDIGPADDTLTTVHLVGFWYGASTGPISLVQANVRLTVRNLYGPFTHPATYTGAFACRPLNRENPYSCPGRRGVLRNIAIGAPEGSGRDALVVYFDADVTFETGDVCHFAGVTLDENVSTLSSLFDCRDAHGAAISQGAFRAHESGPHALPEPV
jgi:hypothetical protein